MKVRLTLPIALGLAALDFGGALSAEPAQPTPPPPPFTEAAPLPNAVAPTDPRVRYEGRFDTSDPAGPRCAWPASSATLRFLGNALNVRLGDTDTDRYQVVVDGRPASILTPKGGTHTYRVFDALKPAPHTVTLVKQTESFFGTTQFLGFGVSKGGRLLPPPARPTRRIEVIGDSISCGYGNLAKDQYEKFSPDNESAYLSYGAVAARALSAEYVCIAWSGRKMWPNNTMPEIYDKTLPLDTSSHWDAAKWTPDAVVVNLSTNDFNGSTPDRKGWIAGYEAFLTRVRTQYPQAAVYCATSPMMGGDQGATAKSYLTQIVADENTAGRQKRAAAGVRDPGRQKRLRSGLAPQRQDGPDHGRQDGRRAGGRPPLDRQAVTAAGGVFLPEWDRHNRPGKIVTFGHVYPQGKAQAARTLVRETAAQGYTTATSASRTSGATWTGRG